jgi:hypothetical protein
MEESPKYCKSLLVFRMPYHILFKQKEEVYETIKGYTGGTELLVNRRAFITER